MADQRNRRDDGETVDNTDLVSPITCILHLVPHYLRSRIKLLVDCAAVLGLGRSRAISRARHPDSCEGNIRGIFAT